MAVVGYNFWSSTRCIARKIVIYMDGVFGHIYFYYKDLTHFSSSKGEYHNPRDADEVIVHYPLVKPKADSHV
jgi:hypothetical protein